MATKKERATLQSELLSAKGQKRRSKAACAKAQVLLEPASAAPDTSAAAAPQSVQSMLCAKGGATAAGFRPWHWSFERLIPPPIPAASTAAPLPEPNQPAPVVTPAPVIASAPTVTAAPVIAAAPSATHAPAMPRAVCLPVREPVPAFAYPCNSSTAVVDETPSVANHSAERALWLATSKTIAGLISRELDGREAVAAAARLDQQRRAESTAPTGGRTHPPVTAEGLIAELQTVRRGSVRGLRKGRRTLDATFVGLCVAMVVSAGILSYTLIRSDGIRFGWLAAAQSVRPALSFASGSLPTSIIEIARN
jgi:hypothetical protein